MKTIHALFAICTVLPLFGGTILLDNPKELNLTVKGIPDKTWVVRKSREIPGKPNTWYRVTLEIKTALKPGPGVLTVRVRNIRANGKSLVYNDIARLKPAFLNYSLYSATFFTKPETARLQVYFQLSRLDGTASFRNLKLEELSEEEAAKERAAFQVAPAWFSPPVYAYEGERELSWGYRVSADFLAPDMIPDRIGFKLPQLQAEGSEKVKINTHACHKLRLKEPLRKGKYQIVMTALDKAGKELAREERILRVIARPQTAHRLPVKSVRLDRSGNTVINGKPVLLNGLYHVYTEAEIREVADAGFNTVIAWEPGPEKYLKMLNHISKYDLYADCVLKLLRGEKLTALLQKIGSHPSVISFDAVDEPDIKDIRPAVIRECVDQVRKECPDKLIRISCSSSDAVKTFGQYAEIICSHNYVIPFGGLPMQAKYSSQVTGSVPGSEKNSPQLTLQSWIHWHDMTRKPQTPEQTRSLAYIALISGAKGLWWYSFIDKGSWDVRSVPSIWTTFKGLNAELNELAPLILTGKKTVLKNESAEPGILGALWESPERTVLVAVNPEKKAAEVQFSVSGKKAAELFADDAEYPVNSGKLKLELPAETTRIFELE
ncbi:MAG: hypothetical protein E7055_09885 [Lentisphaerae bacterium]|nr:hypothetical protein [Lentisphaerota bacterium]